MASRDELAVTEAWVVARALSAGWPGREANAFGREVVYVVGNATVTLTVSVQTP